MGKELLLILMIYYNKQKLLENNNPKNRLEVIYGQMLEEKEFKKVERKCQPLNFSPSTTVEGDGAPAYLLLSTTSRA
mgnify:CR=1 FL=1